MSRSTRRSGSNSCREDDLRVTDLVNEFQSLEEHELKSFFSTLVNNQDIQACLFRVISRDRSQESLESRELELNILKNICNLLLVFYRNLVSQASKASIMLASTASDLSKSRPVVMQYLPHLTAVHLCANQSSDPDEKRSFKFVEAFLLAVYNTEAADTLFNFQQQHQQPNSSLSSTRVPGLSQSSIFHESDRLDAESIDKLNRRSAGPGGAFTIPEPIFRQVKTVNASSRGPILQLLWRAFNRHLPDLSKYAIEQVARVTVQLLNCSSGRRVYLAPPILVEILYLAYFCIYNGFQVLGNQILDQIEERASANGWPSVLMVSTSIKRLSIKCGPSQCAIVTSTPGQLAKHMITNASFRAKKISDDIPKVLADDDGTGATVGVSSSSAAAAARMKSIIEENATEDGGSSDVTSPPSSGKIGKSNHNNGESTGKVHTSNKEKLMSKLPNLKTMTSKKERTQSAVDYDRENSAGEKEDKKIGKSEKLAAEKLSKSEKKKSGKLHVISLVPGSNMSGGGGGSSPSPTSLNSGIAFGRSQNGDGMSVSSKNIESLEQVEELIQMKKLPAETISIHCPESGTTLF